MHRLLAFGAFAPINERAGLGLEEDVHVAGTLILLLHCASERLVVWRLAERADVEGACLPISLSKVCPRGSGGSYERDSALDLHWRGVYSYK